jgi:hypothetical protein
LGGVGVDIDDVSRGVDSTCCTSENGIASEFIAEYSLIGCILTTSLEDALCDLDFF